MKLETDFLKKLTTVPRSGIWALMNHEHKLFYLSHSNNILGGVARNLVEIANHTHEVKQLIFDLPHLEVEIFEAIDEPITKLMHYEYWKQCLIEAGYESYRDAPLASGYKVVIDTDKLARVNPDWTSAIYSIVKLRSKGKREFVLGVFPTMREAAGFINQCYPTPKNIHGVSVAINELTRKYYHDPEAEFALK